MMEPEYAPSYPSILVVGLPPSAGHWVRSRQSELWIHFTGLENEGVADLRMAVPFRASGSLRNGNPLSRPLDGGW